MLKQFIKTLFLLNLAVVSGCGESTLTSDTQQSLLSTDAYLGEGSTVRLYVRNTTTSTFIGYLKPENQNLILPKSLQSSELYSARTSEDILAGNDLVAMVYNPRHSSGDFYFETPIFGPKSTVSNVTTAVSWYLRWMFNGQKIKLTQKNFNQIVLNTELICTDCRKKTNSEVLNLIRTNPALEEYILKTVASLNPTLDTSLFSWTTPQAEMIWSDPLVTGGVGSRTLRELETTTLSVVFVNPNNSTQKITPESWLDSVDLSETASLDDGSYARTFDYDAAGTRSIFSVFDTAKWGVDVASDNISFTLIIRDVNRPPQCDTDITFEMRANILNSDSLIPFCRDPDIEDTDLQYTLEDGPPGLSLTTLGLVSWTPPNQQTDTPYRFKFRVTDPKGLAITHVGYVAVIPDNEPQFNVISASYNFTEGLEGELVVEASDIDEDLFTLTVTAVGNVKVGLPEGAGDLSLIERTGADGVFSFKFKFTPSYMQSLWQDQTLALKFSLNYDNTGTVQYDSSVKFDERIVTLNIANTDDPPVWTSNPVAQIAATEGVNLGGVYVATVTDPNPNPTAMVISVQSSSSSQYCSWASRLSATVNAQGEVYLSGSPPYNTDEECEFRLTAIDSRDLSTQSSSFFIMTANVNRPVTVCSTSNACAANPVVVVNAAEGKTLTLPLAQIFTDPDMATDPVDPRERFEYLCLIDEDQDGIYEQDCASRTDLGFNFNSRYLAGTLAPKALSAGTYAVRLQVTDSGGTTATSNFTLIVAPSPLPPKTILYLSATQSELGTVESTLALNEGQTYYLTLKVEPATSRPIDNYAYSVTPLCTDMSAGGTCSSTFMTLPNQLSGTGTKNFTFKLSPGFNDGDGVFPLTFKNYLLSYTVRMTADLTIENTARASALVTNINRPPTGIHITKGSFGCVGSNDNADDEEFIICINAAKDNKTGSSWSNQYSLVLNHIDPDMPSGNYTYSLNTDALGTIENGEWNFKIPSCAYASAGTISKNYRLTLSDGQGGTYVRNIVVRIQKAGASATCM